MIRGFSDADWRQQSLSCKSAGGHVGIPAGGAERQRSKQQFFASQTSKAEEYVPLAMCLCEILWMEKFRVWMGKVLGPGLSG